MAHARGAPDTIAALATAPGRAALAVIRISGPGASDGLKALRVKAVRPGAARLCSLKGASGAILDRAIVIWRPAPSSYTGEDCAEIHLHGSRFLSDTVMRLLTEAGLRLAEPGEFTRRAFENGKIDLGQAEAVADLIDAETEAQARQAIDQLEGALGSRYVAWRGVLIEILARLEALVDFPEEATGEAVTGVRGMLDQIMADLTAAVEDGARGRRIRDGYRVAIVGPANAGKSSLFNRLVDRDAAIVAALPGTTRDVIEAAIDLGGYRVLLADTAGLRPSGDPVEIEGVRRARAWARDADLRIWVIDGAAADLDPEMTGETWLKGDLCVLNKNDLPLGPASGLATSKASRHATAVVAISTLSDGPERVAAWLRETVVAAMAGADFPATTRMRHDAALRDGLEAICRAHSRLDQPELAAEDVRLTARALAQVTGAIATEHILEKVFSAFCIGK